MKKVLKFTGIILGIVVLALIICVGMLATTVSPNKLKPIITAQVLKATGRTLTIDGDLSWSFFPYLSVKIGHASLSNPPEFKQKIFAEFAEATMGVKLMPLLHSNIEASGLTLTGLTLNLIKNAEGKTNWQDFLLPNATSEKAVTQETVPTKSNNTLAVGLMIPSVDVNQAHVTWTNEQTRQSVDISQFEFHTTDISWNHAFPVSCHFNYAAQNPTLSGEGSLEGKIALNLRQQIYTIQNLILKVTTKKGSQDISLSVNGDVVADLNKQAVKIENLETQVANAKLNGFVNIADISAKPVVTGHLAAQPFDLKQFLLAIGQDTASLQSASSVSADFDFATNPTAPNAVHAVNVHGNIKLGELQAANLKLSDLSIKTSLQNGLLDMSPVSANLYQGKLQGHAQVNLNAVEPQVTLQANLSGVQAEPLLRDLGAEQDKIKVMGAGNIEVQITSSGLDAATITRHLNGTVRFSFNDGKVDGINVGFMIDSAYALLKGKPTPAENDKSTHFGNLTGTASIVNGIITNKDLFMNAPRFDTSGQGTINLVSRQIDYSLQAMPKLNGQDDKNPMNLNHLAIPVRITGSLQNPSIVPDTGAIAKELANAELKKVQNHLQDKIQDQIKNKLSGQAGDLVKGLLGN